MAYPSNLGKKKGGPSAIGAVVRTLAWIVLPLALLYGALWWRADVMIEKQFEALRVDKGRPVDIRRDGTVLGLNGDIGIKDLVVRPLPSSDAPDISFKAKRLIVHTPSLWWLVRSAVMGPPKEIPSRFGFSIEQGELEGSDAAIEQLIDSGYGGNVFFPFDLAGCSSGASLETLKELGLDTATMSIDATMTHPNPNDMQLRIEVDNSAQAKIDAEINIELGAGQDLSMQAATASLRSIEVAYIDRGYAEKRNSYCAKRLDVTPEQFVERHLEAARQWFAEENGLLPGAAMTQAYGQFAKSGGALVIKGKPVGPGPLASMRGMRLRNLGIYLDATVQHDDDFPAPLVFLPADDYRKSTVGDASGDVSAPNAPPSVVLVAPGQEVPFEDMSAYLGARVSVSTRYDTVRRGIVQGASSLSFVIKLDAGEGGGYSLTLPKSSVAKIVLVTPPPPSDSGDRDHAETQ